ncbi:MAG: Lrp/AsnC ligand binding domain-containing protein [Nitrososphaera sp.]
MFIQCKQGLQEEIVQKAKGMPRVAYAYKLDKAYDVVVKIESNSVEEFTSAISKIRVIGGILNTDTMIGFKKS